MALTIHIGPEQLIEDLEELQDELERTFADLMQIAFKRQVLPAMRRATPRRTGALRMSMFVERGENRIGIAIRQPGESYWRFQNRGQLPDRLEAIFADLMQQLIPLTIRRTREIVLGRQ